MKFTKKDKEWLNWFIRCAVKDGCLEPEEAEKMTYEDKQKYLDWCDYEADRIMEAQKYGEN